MANERRTEEERLAELRESGEAIGKLAEDAERFRRAVEAFRAQDAERFQTELAAAELLDVCHFVCRWLCSKHCVFICLKLCGRPEFEERDELDIDEMREFAQRTARIAHDEDLLKRLLDAMDREDVEAWRALVAELDLQRFCHQLCHWLCFVRCRLVCELLCPRPPLITAVGFIPTSQIDSQGYGSGVDKYLTNTPTVDKPSGIGDHPFGGFANIEGALSIANPFQYKVEYATDPAGPWTPITETVHDLEWNGTQIVPHPRSPTGPDGWYNVADMGLLGLNYLTNWPTPPVNDELYYLKLTVRNGMMAEFPSPVVRVRVDNGLPEPGVPPSPVIKLQLKEPNGILRDLGCCETVTRGDGNVIVISLQAWDPNFSRIDVTLYGGCGVSLPIHSKTYNGNLADTGYPTLTSFDWDPWAAGVAECCYVIWVQIWDRAIVNNQWAGRHSRVNWQSITIA